MNTTNSLQELQVPNNFPREVTDYILLNCGEGNFISLCSVDKHLRELVQKLFIENLSPPIFSKHFFDRDKAFSYSGFLTAEDESTFNRQRSLMTHLRQDYEKLSLRNKAWHLAYDLPLHAQIGMIPLCPIENLVQALSKYHQTGLLDEAVDGKHTSPGMKQREIFQNTPVSLLKQMEVQLKKYTTKKKINLKRYQNGQFDLRIEKLSKEILFSVPKEMILGFEDKASNCVFCYLPKEVFYKIMMIYLDTLK